jgi:O-antigen/teichoic acid export membrane protein
VAQSISIITAPVLTRIFTPQALGGYGIFLAIVSAILPSMGGRYEIATVAAYSKRLSKEFYWIAQYFTLFISIGLLIFITLFLDPIYKILKPNFNPFILLLIPVCLFLSGSVSNLKAWANSIQKYNPINLSSIYHNITFSLFAISLGLFSATSKSLIFSSIFGYMAAYIYFLKLFPHAINWKQGKISTKRAKLAWHSRDYPIFNGSTSILNGIMTYLPVFYLSKYFNQEIVGFYTILMRVGVAPLSLISDAISKVNHKKISELIYNKKNLLKYFYKISFYLLLIVLLPCIVIIIFGANLFSIIFGPAWSQAGELLSILMPAIGVQFVVSTLSLSLTSAGHLRLLAYWQIFSFVISVIAFTYAAMGSDIYWFFKIYMAKDLVLYFIYYGIMVYALKNPKLLQPITKK